MDSEISEKSIGQFERKSFFLVLILGGMGYVLVNLFFESPFFKELSFLFLLSPFIYLILQYRKIKSDLWIKICLAWASFFILAKISYKFVAIIQSPSPYFLPVYFTLVSILVIFLNSDKLFENFLRGRENILAFLLLVVSLGLTLRVFFHHYLPPSRFVDSSLNSAVDAPVFYYTGWYQAQTFYQGRIAGWNDNFYGGYPTILEVGRFGHGVTLFFLSLVLSHFVSFPVIYKIHLLVLYLLPIPALFLLTNEIFGKLEAGIASILAFLLVTTWAFNLMYLVSVGSVLGWDALLFSLYFAYKYLKTPKKLYFVFMILLAALSFCSHPISMILTILTIPIVLVLGPGPRRKGLKKKLSRIASFFVALGLIVFPYYLYLTVYNDFLQATKFRITHSLLGFPGFLYSRLLFSLRGFGLLTDIFYFFLPLAILGLLIYKKRRKELSIWYVLLITFIATEFLGFMGPRTEIFSQRAYLFLLLISIVPISFGIGRILANAKGFFTLICAALLLFLPTHLMFPRMGHFQPYQELGGMNSLATLLGSLGEQDAIPSNQGRLMIEGAIGHSVFTTLGGRVIPYIQLSTNREMLSGLGISPWAWHKYRYRCMKDGVFFGKNITEWSIEELEEILKNYAVQYIVVWSEIGRSFFQAKPGAFIHVKDIKNREAIFSIFKFRNSEIDRTRIIGQGTAALISNKPNEKIVSVKNANETTRVILKYNYFPHWKAKTGEKKIKIDNWKSIMSVKPKKKGDYQITFYFPRFWQLDYGKLFNLIHL